MKTHIDTFDGQRVFESVQERDLATSTTPDGKAGSPSRMPAWGRLVPPGLLIGAVSAAVSLMVCAAVAPYYGVESFWIINVYLTFPWLDSLWFDLGGGMMSLGFCLYLITGALYGVAFHWLMLRHLAKLSHTEQLLYTSLIGIGLWVINYYLILYWLQPVVGGERLIALFVPMGMGAAVHLAFVWAMLFMEWLPKLFAQPGLLQRKLRL